MAFASDGRISNSPNTSTAGRRQRYGHAPAVRPTGQLLGAYGGVGGAPNRPAPPSATVLLAEVELRPVVVEGADVLLPLRLRLVEALLDVLGEALRRVLVGEQQLAPVAHDVGVDARQV